MNEIQEDRKKEILEEIKRNLSSGIIRIPTTSNFGRRFSLTNQSTELFESAVACKNTLYENKRILENYLSSNLSVNSLKLTLCDIEEHSRTRWGKKVYKIPRQLCITWKIPKQNNDVKIENVIDNTKSASSTDIKESND